MKIYIAHASSFDYQHDLYHPLQTSSLWTDHAIVLPHEHSQEPTFNSRPVIATSDLLIAEVSYPSTGMGIEIGWAVAHDIPVLAFHRHDAKPSSAIKMVTDHLYTYHASDDLIQKINDYILNLDSSPHPPAC